MRPFARELQGTGIPEPRLWAQRILQGLTWNYLSRRVYIAQCLTKRVQSTDSRLTVGAFAPPAVSNPASQI